MKTTVSCETGNGVLESIKVSVIFVEGGGLPMMKEIGLRSPSSNTTDLLTLMLSKYLIKEFL